MEKSTEILDELQSISSLIASLPKVNVLRVPDGYFTALEQKILTNVLLHQENKKEDLQVPEGYFDTLSTRILHRIKNENTNEVEAEINPLSPVLLSLKNKNIYTVPPDYFQNLSGEIKNKLNPNEGKVIPIGTRKQWWKYAAAAVITGAIAITSLQIFNNNNSSTDNNIITASSKVPDYIKMSFQYKTPQQLNQGIASLTNDEIASYLEKSGSIIDDDLLTTGINTNQMPAPNDYLIDENALNNYLNMIGAQSIDKNTQ